MRFCLIVAIWLSSGLAHAGTFSTPNFVATAADAGFAKEVAETAERKREELAVLWFGKPFPRWSQPCPIAVTIDNTSGGGTTYFQFDNGQVFGWDMKVSGTREAVIDDVVPHEVNHTLFATYFRRPVPRWADEGSAVTVEGERGRAMQRQLLTHVYKTRWFIPFKPLMEMTEYPASEYVGSLYSEGWGLTTYLIDLKDHRTFVDMLAEQPKEGWEDVIEKKYGFKNTHELYECWCKWVDSGMPLKASKAPAIRGPNGNKAKLVFFYSTTCTSCKPLHQAILRNEFSDYDVYVVCVDGPNGRPYLDLNYNERVDLNEEMYAAEYIAWFERETKQEVKMIPILWIPATAQYIIGATEAVEVLRWAATVVRRFMNVIFGVAPPVGVDPANVTPFVQVDPPKPTPPPAPFVPITIPAVSQPIDGIPKPPVEPTEADIDWTDVSIVVLVKTDGKLPESSDRLVKAVRGFINRKIREASDGKADVRVFDDQFDTEQYNQLIEITNSAPDPVKVLVLIERQPLGLRSLLVSIVQRKFESEILPKLNQHSVEVVFERQHPEMFQRIKDTVESVSVPSEPFDLTTIISSIIACITGLAAGLGKEWLKKMVGFQKTATKKEELTSE